MLEANGQTQAAIRILQPIQPDAAGGLFRNVFLAMAYAAENRLDEAADTLLLISGV